MRTVINSVESTNGNNNLHIVVWKPEKEIKAIVQISHGMIEYIERYDEFARFLNERSILVIGNDHLGHGKTAVNDSELGYFGAEKSKTVVDDLHEITKFAKQEYGIKNIKIKLYENDRHELTNEVDRDVIFEDIFGWLQIYMA